MPVGLVKSVAKSHGLSEERVERHWNECKASVAKALGHAPKTDSDWARVNGCVQKRAAAAASSPGRALMKKG